MTHFEPTNGGCSRQVVVVHRWPLTQESIQPNFFNCFQFLSVWNVKEYCIFLKRQNLKAKNKTNYDYKKFDKIGYRSSEIHCDFMYA